MQVGFECVERYALIWLNAVLNKAAIKTIIGCDVKHVTNTCRQDRICSSTCLELDTFGPLDEMNKMFVWPYPNVIEMILN